MQLQRPRITDNLSGTARYRLLGNFTCMHGVVCSLTQRGLTLACCVAAQSDRHLKAQRLLLEMWTSEVGTFRRPFA